MLYQSLVQYETAKNLLNFHERQLAIHEKTIEFSSALSEQQSSKTPNRAAAEGVRWIFSMLTPAIMIRKQLTRNIKYKISVKPEDTEVYTTWLYPR